MLRWVLWWFELPEWVWLICVAVVWWLPAWVWLRLWGGEGASGGGGFVAAGCWGGWVLVMVCGGFGRGFVGCGRG